MMPGFVPNVRRALAWRAPRFWKWCAHRNDLMTPSAGLSKADREMGAVVSAMKDCLYTNRLASAAGWLPNPEYHGLARCRHGGRR